ncbi:hypothetical protein OnM2_029079 [Erysiphe neolycopersici]|uniref:Peptidase A2 domain-containing protein n=1 Tax=Erysiphe neolycopersici TaxID=212602 RepID=A0A420HZM4_9PEZI|nr:hypothetical protein OnM2_029079 [Erysiphe neolycopersici]
MSNSQDPMDTDKLNNALPGHPAWQQILAEWGTISAQSTVRHFALPPGIPRQIRAYLTRANSVGKASIGSDSQLEFQDLYPVFTIDLQAQAIEEAVSLGQGLALEINKPLSLPTATNRQEEQCIHTFDLGNERPLALTALIRTDVKAYTMIDSGASTSFIDDKFVKKYQLITRPKGIAEAVHVVDGRESASGLITHEIDLPLNINDHSEILTFQVTRIARYDIILGKSWLSKHDPQFPSLHLTVVAIAFHT